MMVAMLNPLAVDQVAADEARVLRGQGHVLRLNGAAPMQRIAGPRCHPLVLGHQVGADGDMVVAEVEHCPFVEPPGIAILSDIPRDAAQMCSHQLPIPL